MWKTKLCIYKNCIIYNGTEVLINTEKTIYTVSLMMHWLTVLSCLMFCLAKTIYLFAKEIELNILFVQSKQKYSSTIVK